MRSAVYLALGALIVAAACNPAPQHASPGPRRPCGLTVWYRPGSAAARVSVIGDWNGWKRPGLVLAPSRADGWRVAQADVAPGEHTYAIVDDGALLPNPNVPTTAYHEGVEVTWVDVPQCDVPALRVDAVETSDDRATVDLTFFAASGGDAIDAASIALPGATTEVDGPRVRARFGGLARGKHVFTARARDVSGRDAEPARITVWIEPRPFDVRDAVVYQVMVDRFRGDDGALAPPPSPAGRAGGTLRGLTRAIEAGALDHVGANVLWLSPLYVNPDGAFPGLDGRAYSSYHGYWPLAARGVDPRLGGESELDALVVAAHARGVRVIFDVVPNHVHEQHPYWSDHRDWFNVATPRCICGAGTCDWATHIQSCWFAPYMPDLDWRRSDVAKQATEDVLYWLDRFDGDGVRIDAVPMTPRAATRRIVTALRARFEHTGNALFVLGENFTGPGGYGLLRYQLGPFGLDGQFHFPLMWALRRAVAAGTAPLSDVAAAVAAGEEAWRGSGAVMGTMLGNHDVTRFASESAGDAEGDGWTPAPEPTDSTVYAKQRFALAILYALPGAPVVYYGDEVALAGRSDPDSRRVMPADEALSSLQRETRAFTARLGRARACSAALRRGGYRLLYADAERWVFAREVAVDAAASNASKSIADASNASTSNAAASNASTSNASTSNASTSNASATVAAAQDAPAGERVAVVVVTRGPAAPQGVALPGIPDGEWKDLLEGATTTLTSELTKIDLAPFSVRLFVPAASTCAGR